MSRKSGRNQLSAAIAEILLLDHKDKGDNIYIAGYNAALDQIRSIIAKHKAG
jgi:hypothetical protein